VRAPLRIPKGWTAAAVPSGTTSGTPAWSADYNPCSDPSLMLPLAIRVSEPGGTHVDLMGEQRGVLPLLDGTELHIDAPLAHRHSGDCHNGPGNAFRIVTRRVSP
jgi:hypothetical protein